MKSATNQLGPRDRFTPTSRRLLVTLADEAYLDQAKQLFASAYFSGGWRDDFMLLTDKISPANRQWFEQRGIFVNEASVLYSSEKWNVRRERLISLIGKIHPVITTLKCHLFSEDLKGWDWVVYLDADMIVRAPMGGILNHGRLACVPDLSNRIHDQFLDSEALSKKLGPSFDFNSLSFNSGMLSFPTSMITPTSFDELTTLFDKCLDHCKYGEQGIFNLWLYQQWKRLGVAYDCFVTAYLRRYVDKVYLDNFNGVILHFADRFEKPWEPRSEFYDEWASNLSKASQLGSVTLPPPSALAERITRVKAAAFPLKLRLVHAWYFRKTVRAKLTNQFPVLRTIKRKLLAKKEVVAQEENAFVIRAALEKILETKPELQIIQIGAHTGDTWNDPLHLFLKEHASKPDSKVRALLIEPVPALFAKLVETYRNCPSIILANVAIAEKAGTAKIYRLPDGIRPEEHGLPEWITQLSSLRPDRMTELWSRYETLEHWNAKAIQDFYAKHRIEETVECVTLPALLEKHGISHVDLLTMDTEGYDFTILKSLDFATFKPTIINYERVLMLENEPECRAMMKKGGYRLRDHGQDTLATYAPSLSMVPELPVLPLDESPMHWQMHRHERYTLETLLQFLKPTVAVEVGIYRGGSLSVIARHSGKVHALDKNPAMKLELTTRFKNVEYHDGDSRIVLPKLLHRLQKNNDELSFILVDGDHSANGVRSDIESILKYRPTRPLYVLLHDSFNPDCRQGMLSANWQQSEHVHFVDIDFAPGAFYDTPFGMAEEKSMWGGFALAVLYPEKREGTLDILQSQKSLFDAARMRSRYVGRREKLRACLRALREIF